MNGRSSLATLVVAGAIMLEFDSAPARTGALDQAGSGGSEPRAGPWGLSLLKKGWTLHAARI